MAGRRILVVEDEFLIALEIEDVLGDMGCEVVGPTGVLADALKLAGSERLDAAVLDVNINGGKSYPVAELLIARGVPVLLASGYSDWALPEALRGRPRLTKPYGSRELARELSLLCGAPPADL